MKKKFSPDTASASKSSQFSDQGWPILRRRVSRQCPSQVMCMTFVSPLFPIFCLQLLVRISTPMDSQGLVPAREQVEPPPPSAVLYLVAVLNPPSIFRIPFRIFKFSEFGDVVFAQVLAPNRRATLTTLQSARSLKIVTGDCDHLNTVVNVVLSKQDFYMLQRASRYSVLSKRPHSKHNPPTHACGQGLRRLKIISGSLASYAFLICCWLFFVRILGWHLDLRFCWLVIVKGTWLAFVL
ncbi:hypothetical protein K505DRAFT_395995 [Melanomma pulvis-pyrius CBS 109.77]|uniref:Uncharacterized protein n=1 Tax=Melanomma pulvis-pyrius CBS 109.77 TaxID=1314802 RepID=A0A6A6WV88_9PLEO|nr:hypothetical protein K505DRAFT_395995 [Melanomma pulvis-pyrius CBS 109.77]